MATGTALSELIKDVQYELGHSTVVTVGQNFRDHIAHRLGREYARLYRDFTWPHLRRWVDVALVAGTKTYTLPSINTVALKLADVREVYAFWGGQYSKLTRGIEIDDYNASNSDLFQASDPPQKWAPTDETHFEVWPLPAAAGALRILALKPFVAFAAETDLCLLDDDLLSMHVAAEFLAKAGDKAAPIMALRAKQHYDTLKNRNSTGATRASLAGGGRSADPLDPRNKVFIGVVTG